MQRNGISAHEFPFVDLAKWSFFSAVHHVAHASGRKQVVSGQLNRLQSEELSFHHSEHHTLPLLKPKELLRSFSRRSCSSR